MNNVKIKSKYLVFKYTLFGILFGFLFPLLAIISEIFRQSLTFSWQTIQALHNSQLLWIIDTAPFFLGLFAYNSGVGQKKLLIQTEKLGQLVEQRSKDIVRQKLFTKHWWTTIPLPPLPSTRIKRSSRSIRLSKVCSGTVKRR